MNFYKEQVMMEDNYPAKIYISNSINEPGVYDLHWHEHLEINFVILGEIIGRINGQEVIVSSGEVLLVNSGELHETKNGNCTQVETITILLDYNYIKKLYPKFDSKYLLLNRDSDNYENLTDYLMAIGKVYENPSTYDQLEITVLINQLLLELLKNHSFDKERVNIRSYDETTLKNIKKAIEYIESNYTELITLNTIASFVSMSPSYFSRFFKNHVGKNFHQFLSDYRVYRSRDELVFKDSTITEIAFNNVVFICKGFIEAFKKVYQLTPLQYKKSKIDN